MVFSSILFTFVFLPIVILLYYGAKEEYKNYILLAASLIFYSYGEPEFIFVMMASIVANYWIARGIDSFSDRELFRKGLLLLAIVGNIGILFVFKYLNFSVFIFNYLFKTEIGIRNIVLPIGISFYTFQSLSYIIDVYRKRANVQKNILYLALYISFFPQLIAGPIVRYTTIEEQIAHRVMTMDKFGEGAQRFILGFCKKVLLSNNLSNVARGSFSLVDVTSGNGIYLWVGSICYTLQIFYDFSGYSDMAIGLGKMFGFEFEENFNYPYISKSITEFWRRWHISLGQWFRDYVYIPLGGSRVGGFRQIINLLIVWGATGLWHGANFTFLAWGLGYFILLVIEKFIVKPWSKGKGFTYIWSFITIICVNFGWVIFNSPGLRYGIKYCLAMLGVYGNRFAVDQDIVMICREYGFFILIAVIFAMPTAKWLDIVTNKVTWMKNVKAILLPAGYMLLFGWAVSFLILGAHNPFIYFNF